jgi:hypothetical protein
MGTVDHIQSESATIEELIDHLKSCFVDELVEVGQDAGAKLLRLFDVWRQVSLRRIVDLAESADGFFRQSRLLPGNILTRSLVETVAVQFAVWKRLDSLTIASDVNGIHNLLMSVVFGRRDKGEDWPNKSMNVITAIDHLEKRLPGFRSEYERLCEYAHPGLAGGYGMYVRTEGEKLRSFFGQNPLGLEMDHWGRTELRCSMLVAVTFNDFLSEVRPRIQALVEQHA